MQMGYCTLPGLAAAIVQVPKHRGSHAVGPRHPIGQQFCLLAAEELVKADPSRIVTFGIRPLCGIFGYMRAEDPRGLRSIAAFNVESFREKPDRDGSRVFTQDLLLEYGIRVESFNDLEALKSNVPEMYDHLLLPLNRLNDLYPQEERFTALRENHRLRSDGGLSQCRND